MKKTTLFFLIAGMPLFSFAQSSHLPPLDSRPVLIINEKYKLVPKNIHETNARANYVINIRYPEIIGTGLNATANHFNQLIKNFVDTQIQAFKKNFNSHAVTKKPAVLAIDYQETGFVSQSQHTEFESLRFEIQHFNTKKIITINYDFGHDKAFSLADLFNPHTPYLKAIADYCTKQLTAKNLPGLKLSGAAAKPENYANWNFTLTGDLLITFNPGQVADQKLGPQEVVVPKQLLATWINHKTACTIELLNCDGT